MLLLFANIMAYSNTPKNPYAKMQPWVEYYVWEMPPVKSIDEFLKKYKVPKSGNKAKDKNYQQKLFNFAKNFKKLTVSNQDFIVTKNEDINSIKKNSSGHPAKYAFTLKNQEGDKISCIISAFESEQNALDYYPRKYWTASGNFNVLLVYAKHIEFGVFCRYIQQDRFIEYIKGSYTIELYGKTKLKDKHLDMPKIAFALDKELNCKNILAEKDSKKAKPNEKQARDAIENILDERAGILFKGFKLPTLSKKSCTVKSQDIWNSISNQGITCSNLQFIIKDKYISVKNNKNAVCNIRISTYNSNYDAASGICQHWALSSMPDDAIIASFKVWNKGPGIFCLVDSEFYKKKQFPCGKTSSLTFVRNGLTVSLENENNKIYNMVEIAHIIDKKILEAIEDIKKNGPPKVKPKKKAVDVSDSKKDNKSRSSKKSQFNDNFYVKQLKKLESIKNKTAEDNFAVAQIYYFGRKNINIDKAKAREYYQQAYNQAKSNQDFQAKYIAGISAIRLRKKKEGIKNVIAAADGGYAVAQA